VALANNLGAASDPDFQRAKPYIEPFGALVGGSKRSGDRLESRLRITLP
jgi:hypothetical protein